jgi:hypothetical protein
MSSTWLERFRVLRTVVRNILILALFLPFVAASALSQTLSIDAPMFDAGTVTRGIAITKEFVVKNTGSADLHILDVKPMCGCMAAKFDKTIQPGAEGKITLTLDTKAFRSAISKVANVFSNDPTNSQMRLIVVANVKGYVSAIPSESLRIQTTVGQLAAAELILVSDSPNFKPISVATTQSYLHATLTPDQAPNRWKVRVLCDSRAPLGPLSGSVIVQTGIAQEPQLSLSVSGIVGRAGEARETEPQLPKSATPALANDDVVKLVAAGLDDEVVIAKVKNAASVRFDVTTDALVALKTQNVSKAVLAAMIERDAIQQKSQSAKIASSGPEPVAPAPSSPCADIDYLGVIQAVTGGGEMAGHNAYGGRVRNRASYTKEVDFSWTMNGRSETGTFRIPPGQFIDVNLGQGSAPPTNVHVVTCR